MPSWCNEDGLHLLGNSRALCFGWGFRLKGLGSRVLISGGPDSLGHLAFKIHIVKAPSWCTTFQLTPGRYPSDWFFLSNLWWKLSGCHRTVEHFGRKAEKSQLCTSSRLLGSLVGSEKKEIVFFFFFPMDFSWSCLTDMAVFRQPGYCIGRASWWTLSIFEWSTGWCFGLPHLPHLSEQKSTPQEIHWKQV